MSHGMDPDRTKRRWAGGALTVAVVGTFEAGETNPYAVVSAEMLAAYEKLSNLARGLGLKTEYRVVPPPGMVDLNPPIWSWSAVPGFCCSSGRCSRPIRSWASAAMTTASTS
ncbi:hypothetical protein GCM10009848_35320 [Micromonospora lupini]